MKRGTMNEERGTKMAQSRAFCRSAFRVHRSSFKRSAFTLIELVLSMAMVAIVAASLYASMRTAFKAKASAEAAVEPPRTAELAMEMLRADFQNAMPPTGILAGIFTGSTGIGTGGHDNADVSFYTTADAPEHEIANGEIKLVELTIATPVTTSNVASASSSALVRRVTRNLLAQQQPTPDEEVICRGVTAFIVRYFDGTDWQDSWDSTAYNDSVPAAVEVTLELERPGDLPNTTKTLRYVRVFPLACSTVSADSTGATQ